MKAFLNSIAGLRYEKKIKLERKMIILQQIEKDKMSSAKDL